MKQGKKKKNLINFRCTLNQKNFLREYCNDHKIKLSELIWLSLQDFFDERENTNINIFTKKDYYDLYIKIIENSLNSDKEYYYDELITNVKSDINEK